MTGNPSQSDSVGVQCCIVGGGPAGMMLGLLLARAGVRVTVLEKHDDFLRDFRGDTIHPSTLEVINDLGLLEPFLARPHQRLERIGMVIGGTWLEMADFTGLRATCPFIALMPQWEFLDFLASEAARYPNFTLRRATPATALLRANGRVIGVEAESPTGPIEIRADLTVAADGRASILRADAGLPVDELGAPMDVLWMRLPRRPDDPGQTLGRVAAGTMFIMLDRGDYWQCALLIPKGSMETVKERGLEAIRRQIGGVAPFLDDRLATLDDWQSIKLLTVRVDRLRRWHLPGLLCIGDAAHAMSPIGGVGINLAIQDAVAAANRLADPLRAGRMETADLAAVERRRRFPTRITQRVQVLAQNRIIERVLARAVGEPISPPLAFRAASRFGGVRRLLGWAVGVGPGAERVEVALQPSVTRGVGHPPSSSTA